MASITLKGEKINTSGKLPEKGTKAPEFKLVKTDLSDAALSDYSGKKVVLNIFPSLDTSVCAMSVRRFNKDISSLDNTVLLSISADLPFAHGRFCSTEGLENTVNLSVFRNSAFGSDYGLTITDGPLAGLLSRAVIVIDEDGRVVYTEQVPEIAQEPDYDSALAALK